MVWPCKKDETRRKVREGDGVEAGWKKTGGKAQKEMDGFRGGGRETERRNDG